jgi:hypothetical protein
VTHDEMVEELCTLADAALKQETPSPLRPENYRKTIPKWSW